MPYYEQYKLLVYNSIPYYEKIRKILKIHPKIDVKICL